MLKMYKNLFICENLESFFSSFHDALFETMNEVKTYLSYGVLKVDEFLKSHEIIGYSQLDDELYTSTFVIYKNDNNKFIKIVELEVIDKIKCYDDYYNDDDIDYDVIETLDKKTPLFELLKDTVPEKGVDFPKYLNIIYPYTNVLSPVFVVPINLDEFNHAKIFETLEKMFNDVLSSYNYCSGSISFDYPGIFITIEDKLATFIVKYFVQFVSK